LLRLLDLGAGEAAGTHLEGTLDEGNRTSKDAFDARCRGSAGGKMRAADLAEVGEKIAEATGVASKDTEMEGSTDGKRLHSRGCAAEGLRARASGEAERESQMGGSTGGKYEPMAEAL
jgi:hypothetical protein